MQAVRHAVYVCGQLYHTVLELSQPVADRRRLRTQVLLEFASFDGEGGQALGQVVVQLASQPPPFLFLRGEQFPGELLQCIVALPEVGLAPS